MMTSILRWFRRKFYRHEDDLAPPVLEGRRTPPDTRHTAALFYDVWTAYSWAQSRTILEEHPDLLSSDNLALFSAIVAVARRDGKPKMAAILEEHLDVMQRSRSEGIERAFAAKVQDRGVLKLEQGPDPEKLNSAFSALLSEPHQLERHLGEHPELLSDATDAVAESLCHDLCTDDEGVALVSALNGLRARLARARYDYCRALGDRWFSEERWAEAVVAYRIACDASDVLLWTLCRKDEKRAVVVRDGEIFRCWAYALARAGDARAAAVALERGKTRILRDRWRRRRLDRTSFPHAGAEAVEAFMAVKQAFERLEGEEYGGGLVEPQLIPEVMRGHAYRLSQLTPEQMAAYNAAQSRLLVLMTASDPDDRVKALQVQFRHVLPSYLAGEAYHDSPFYDPVAFEELRALFAELEAKLGDRSQIAVDGLDVRLLKAFEVFVRERARVGLGIEMMSWPEIESLFATLTQKEDGVADAVIYLATTEKGSVGVTLTRATGGVHVGLVEMPFTSRDLDALIDGDARWPGWSRAYAKRERLLQPWMDAIERAIERLSRELIQPVVGILGKPDGKRVALLASGRLAILPLGAVFERAAPGAACHLAPSFEAWHDAAQSAGSARRDNLLAILNPTPTTMDPLEDARREIAVISTRFFQRRGDSAWLGPRINAGEHATPRFVARNMDEYHPVVHFACHGVADPANPEESGVILAGDRRLRVRELLHVNSLGRSEGSRLAVLACCETGLDTADVTDEALTLPGALLYARFAGVVATLWDVPGVSTGLLMIRFYDEWLDRGRAPVDALCAATRWLAGTTDEEKREYLERLAEATRAADLPGDARNEALEALSWFTAELPGSSGERAFEHPYFWAGFYLMGA